MKAVAGADVLQDLLVIPGVGRAVATDLWRLGIHRVSDLHGQDPERLHQRLCGLQNQPVDRCMLYVFRCAVYFANQRTHDPELLKWWNWKDQTTRRRQSL